MDPSQTDSAPVVPPAAPAPLPSPTTSAGLTPTISSLTLIFAYLALLLQQTIFGVNNVFYALFLPNLNPITLIFIREVGTVVLLYSWAVFSRTRAHRKSRGWTDSAAGLAATHQPSADLRDVVLEEFVAQRPAKKNEFLGRTSTVASTASTMASTIAPSAMASTLSRSHGRTSTTTSSDSITSKHTVVSTSCSDGPEVKTVQEKAGRSKKRSRFPPPLSSFTDSIDSTHYNASYNGVDSAHYNASYNGIDSAHYNASYNGAINRSRSSTSMIVPLIVPTASSSRSVEMIPAAGADGGDHWTNPRPADWTPSPPPPVEASSGGEVLLATGGGDPLRDHHDLPLTPSQQILASNKREFTSKRFRGLSLPVPLRDDLLPFFFAASGLLAGQLAVLCGIKIYVLPQGAMVGSAFQPLQPVIALVMNCILLRIEVLTKMKTAAIVLGSAGAMMLVLLKDVGTTSTGGGARVVKGSGFASEEMWVSRWSSIDAASTSSWSYGRTLLEFFFPTTASKIETGTDVPPVGSTVGSSSGFSPHPTLACVIFFFGNFGMCINVLFLKPGLQSKRYTAIEATSFCYVVTTFYLILFTFCINGLPFYGGIPSVLNVLCAGETECVAHPWTIPRAAVPMCFWVVLFQSATAYSLQNWATQSGKGGDEDGADGDVLIVASTTFY